LCKQVSPERGFAFIEFADMMDATCALALDGIPYMGVALKIKRPKDYNIPYGVRPWHRLAC
jgi:splicing factor U2AF subunit